METCRALYPGSVHYRHLCLCLIGLDTLRPTGISDRQEQIAGNFNEGSIADKEQAFTDIESDRVDHLVEDCLHIDLLLLVVICRDCARVS